MLHFLFRLVPTITEGGGGERGVAWSLRTYGVLRISRLERGGAGHGFRGVKRVLSDQYSTHPPQPPQIATCVSSARDNVPDTDNVLPYYLLARRFDLPNIGNVPDDQITALSDDATTYRYSFYKVENRR
jgi:hypothetical protein